LSEEFLSPIVPPDTDPVKSFDTGTVIYLVELIIVPDTPPSTNGNMFVVSPPVYTP
jgi:hypothetical protein